jgi:isocitrate dehydrogenase
MPKFKLIQTPSQGGRITVKAGKWSVPEDPIIPFIRGDGSGPEAWAAAKGVFDAAVRKAYKGRRRLVWMEIPAGEASWKAHGSYLPDETLQAIRRYAVAIKGPLATPVGGGIRSLNVTLRQTLDLYACVRPVRYFAGVPSPTVHAADLDVVIFRENTEDLYAGIEWPSGSKEAKAVIAFLKRRLGKTVRPDSGVGIKPMSAFGSKRLIRRALDHALAKGRRSVTLVHKGNIMKYTEGAFMRWGYELAAREYRGRVLTEQQLAGRPLPKGKVLLKDIIADNMFQQILLNPKDYDVLATPNLNGDYLSDACAAQVGGLGIAPGANIGDQAAVFEATHGTAPRLAGLDRINPSSVILSGCMMLEHLGWDEASKLIQSSLARTILQKTVTADLARDMKGGKVLGCKSFGLKLQANL